jgi:hypothetical protein
MSRPGLLAMDSFQLAKYATPVPCYICDGVNATSAELCRHCQAPMALAHQVQQSVTPQMVAVLGTTGSGKTVYLGMLTDMLSRYSSELQLLARGAFSISLQQATAGALSQCEFPLKTPNEPDRWNWVHSRVLVPQKNQKIELIMPDVAGEALMEEIEHPHSYPVIRAFLSKCAAVLILIDIEGLDEGCDDQDYFGMKMITYLNEMNSDAKSGWGSRPISIVFTKSDQCDACFEDPVAFARQRTPGLFKQCHERLRRCRFFASSVAGACAFEVSREGRFRVPLRIEPRGVTEPFVWLIHQLTGTK